MARLATSSRLNVVPVLVQGNVYANRARLTPNELVLRLDELEAALRSPIADGKFDKAEALAMYIARSAPSGPIANLAMQMMTAANQLRYGNQPGANGSLEKTLSQLRTALQKSSVN